MYVESTMNGVFVITKCGMYLYRHDCENSICSCSMSYIRKGTIIFIVESKTINLSCGIVEIAFVIDGDGRSGHVLKEYLK